MVSEAIEKVQIVVDDRERPSGVVAELEKLDGVTVEIERLTVGDYCIDGAVLIERKTAVDFAQSLMDGRLFVPFVVRPAADRPRPLPTLNPLLRDLAPKCFSAFCECSVLLK